METESNDVPKKGKSKKTTYTIIGVIVVAALLVAAAVIPAVISQNNNNGSGGSSGGGSSGGGSSGGGTSLGYNQAVEEYIDGIEYDPNNCIVSTDGVSLQQQYTWNGDSNNTTTTKYTKQTASNNGSGVLENLGSQTTRVYPGAILKADTNLANGKPNTVDADGLTRADTTLSITLPDAASTTVNPKNYNDVKLAIGSMIDDWGTKGTTASMNYTESSSTGSNAKQLSIDLGIDLDFLDGIGIDFDWEDDEETTTYVYDYTRTFYTVSASTQLYSSNYFGPDTTVDQVKKAMNDSPSVFVKDATYGMIILFSATTTSNVEEFDVGLELAIDGHKGDASFAQQEALDNSSYTMTVIGATQSEALTYGVEGEDGSFDDFINKLREYLTNLNVGVTECKNAALLSAETVFLDSGDVAHSYVSTEYIEKTTVYTTSIQLQFANYSSMSAYAKVSYYVYDSIDENGNYVNKTIVTTKWEWEPHMSAPLETTITAKHVGPFTVDLGVHGGPCTIDAYDIGTPQKEIYISIGGSPGNYDSSLRVDGVWVIDQ